MSYVFSIPILNHIAILRVYPLNAGHHIWTFSILLLRRRALLDSKIAPQSRPRFESCQPLKLAPMRVGVRGTLQRLSLWRVPLTRIARERRAQSDLSPQAGR